MDEYTILKKKRKKNGFASTALLISIAIALIAMVGAVLVLNKVDSKNLVTADENSTVADLTNNEDDNNDTTCEGFSKEVVFNENLKTIKEAAISYFTNERLPQTVGESETITLKKMKSEKLVRNVLDASGKSCSESDSYVEVTKADNEYVMKVFLSCSNMEDYIIVHLGCYDYCDSNVCEKKEEPVKEYEYEYKKTISCEMSDWSNWSEWKTKREKTSNLKKEDIKVETSSKEVVDTKDAKKNPVTYNCDKYPGYTLVGTKCIKETTTRDTKDAIPSKYSYNCDKYPGYSVVGTKCVKEETKKEVIDADKSAVTYYCPSGYSLNGTKCERMVSKTETKTATQTCPTGYSLQNGKCIKEVTTTDTKTATATCPEGYTIKNGKCTKTTITTDTVNAEAVYSTKKQTIKTECEKPECTTKTVFSCENGICGNYPQTSCEMVKTTCEVQKDVRYISGYKCPDGYTLKDGKCSKEIKTTDTKNITYVCPSGYTLSGTTCTKTTKTIDSKSVTYTCPKDFSLSGTKCVRSYQEKETINASKNPITYSCKSGYNLNGTKCEKIIIIRDTKDATKTIGGYVCTDGYTLSGTKCYKDIKTADVKNAESSKVTYYCTDGYVLNGTKCTKTISKGVKITYYRYATRTCDGGSTSTEWSTSKNDSILKDKGYKLTGKKREIIVK